MAKQATRMLQVSELEAMVASPAELTTQQISQVMETLKSYDARMIDIERRYLEREARLQQEAKELDEAEPRLTEYMERYKKERETVERENAAVLANARPLSAELYASLKPVTLMVPQGLLATMNPCDGTIGAGVTEIGYEDTATQTVFLGLYEKAATTGDEDWVISEQKIPLFLVNTTGK